MIDYDTIPCHAIIQCGLHQEKRTSTKDRRTLTLCRRENTPAVFLFANQDDLEQALLNWLGEIFEDEDLVILEIQLPLEYKQFLAQSEYEITCSVAIPPQYIRLYGKNIFF